MGCRDDICVVSALKKDFRRQSEKHCDGESTGEGVLKPAWKEMEKG